jgi:hypothetical protein
LTGTTFVPLGGHHDGGAEAFSEQGVFGERKGHFWQASTEKTVRAKIRRTAKRIIEFGRELNQLTYCSSEVIANIDGEEDLLSDELGIRVRIRDQKYIASHINQSPQTVEAFKLLPRAASRLPQRDWRRHDDQPLPGTAGALTVRLSRTGSRSAAGKH